MDGKAEAYDHIVSTMPLTLLVLGLEGISADVTAAAKSLRFRNTILVYLNVQSENLFPDNWIYIHSPQLRVGRITNFRNWSPRLYGGEKSSILALEYWCDEADEFWSREDDRLIELGKKSWRTRACALGGGYGRLCCRINKLLSGIQGGYGSI
jgi:protoporphyrinogen oxidase